MVRLCRDETAEELTRALREYFCQYGTLEEIATDGASVYVSSHTQRFLDTWGVRHRVSSAHNPHSNLRAETAVKSMKRLVTRNTGPDGTLHTDNFAMALLQYRNTPDRDTHRSPAQVLYARQLRDAVPCNPRDLQLRKEWILTQQARESALAKRHQLRGDDLNRQAHPLRPLHTGTVVQVQNQTGSHANKWDKSGTVVEVLTHDAYMVKMDGSGRVTKRNRKYLRPIIPYADVMASPGVSWPQLPPSDPQNTGGTTGSTGHRLTRSQALQDTSDPQNTGGTTGSTGHRSTRSQGLQDTNNTPINNVYNNHSNSSNSGTSGERARPVPAERAQHVLQQDPLHSGDALRAREDQQRPTSAMPDLSPTDAGPVPAADDFYLPQQQRSSPSANENSPTAAPPTAPQPGPQPNPEPTLRRGSRVRFAPEPFGPFGDPSHPYWQAHHARPRIPTPRGEGR